MLRAHLTIIDVAGDRLTLVVDRDEHLGVQVTVGSRHAMAKITQEQARGLRDWLVGLELG